MAAEPADPGLHLRPYQALLALRRRWASLRRGAHRPIEGMPAGCLACRRVHPGASPLTVLLNLRPAAGEAGGLPVGRIVVGTDPAREGEMVTGQLRLGPDEGAGVEEGRP